MEIQQHIGFPLKVPLLETMQTQHLLPYLSVIQHVQILKIIGPFVASSWAMPLGHVSINKRLGTKQCFEI
jgi:hypothetical protein